MDEPVELKTDRDKLYDALSKLYEAYATIEDNSFGDTGTRGLRKTSAFIDLACVELIEYLEPNQSTTKE